MVHMGEIIKAKIEEQGRTVWWLTEKLNMSKTNLYKIYAKSDISTQLLKKFCEVLEYDFFQHLTTTQTVSEPTKEYVPKKDVLTITITDETGEHDVKGEFMEMLNAFAREYMEKEREKAKKKKNKK